jgi:hypothetical protein
MTMAYEPPLVREEPGSEDTHLFYLSFTGYPRLVSDLTNFLLQFRHPVAQDLRFSLQICDIISRIHITQIRLVEDSVIDVLMWMGDKANC